tara:strand:- start:517 stop:735 length:219 start_codon:yes stop_codon:yes gene_type:complete
MTTKIERAKVHAIGLCYYKTWITRYHLALMIRSNSSGSIGYQTALRAINRLIDQGILVLDNSNRQVWFNREY